MMKPHHGAIALLLLLSAALTGSCVSCLRLELSGPPLRALRGTPLGPVELEALRVVGRRPLWATVGHVSLARVRGRVFRPDGSGGGGGGGGGGGFSAALLLGTAADARSLARVAAADVGTAFGCQIVRLPLTEVTCSASVRLPEGFELQMSGSAADLPADGAAIVTVHFDSLGGVWSDAALSDLEARGEVECQLVSERAKPRFSATVRLRASEAVDPTAELTTIAKSPPSPCRRTAAIDLAAVYNFRSEWGADNLVASGRFRVTARGGAKFTAEGAVLPGNSWLEVDTEGGSLTEHMKYDSQWSVFFVFKRSPAAAAAGPLPRATLFSVHRAGNPLACSIVAWTTGGPRQEFVYSRVHNLAAGFADGQTTRGARLDARPDAWNRVGIAYDGGGGGGGARRATSVVINGAAAAVGARYRFPSYASSTPDGLRGALSLGRGVRGPRQGLQGAFRCFGVARGRLRPEEFSSLFDKYCQ